MPAVCRSVWIIIAVEGCYFGIGVVRNVEIQASLVLAPMAFQSTFTRGRPNECTESFPVLGDLVVASIIQAVVSIGNPNYSHGKLEAWLLQGFFSMRRIFAPLATVGPSITMDS